VQRLGAVLGVVENNVDDRAAERHPLAEVVNERDGQAPLVATRSSRSGSVRPP